MTTACLNAISTAVPEHDIHERYVEVIANRLEGRAGHLFRRMAARAEIAHRYSIFAPRSGAGIADDEGGLFRLGAYPGTGTRMRIYEREAPLLAARAISGLGIDPGEVTHLVVASCTGFMAPGLDQRIVQETGLDPSIERTVVGFMGCYAAVNSLRLARHIVRSEPEARVLVVCIELCTLHFQESDELEKNLASMLFADGAAAALVSAEEGGLALESFRPAALTGSAELITWHIGDQGFDMHLSGEVPQRIESAMRELRSAADPGGILRGMAPEAIDLWAVHAGGRTILDAVEKGLELAPEALAASRGVLHEFGNMSSATLLFVLKRLLDSAPPRSTKGIGLAFGPGVAVESFLFRCV